MFLFFRFLHFLCKLRIFREVPLPRKKCRVLIRVHIHEKNPTINIIHIINAMSYGQGCQLCESNRWNQLKLRNWKRDAALQWLLCTTAVMQLLLRSYFREIAFTVFCFFTVDFLFSRWKINDQFADEIAIWRAVGLFKTPPSKSNYMKNI